MTGALSTWLRFGRAPNKAYRLGNPVATDPGGGYSIAFIEFDDQGWYYSLQQRKALSSFLDGKADEDLIILVFIHGWKHNADFGDTNAGKFEELVRGAHLSERARGGGRHVLGVYIGWRGLSLRGNPLWQDLSFYARKNAALRVAIGSVRDTLALLRTFWRQRHPWHPGPGEQAAAPRSETEGTRLFVAGHSFGGLILFSALAEYLMESTYARDIVSPFGDLIVLVNPAFEATRYQPLATALLKHKGFAAGQRPVFIAFTATNDVATGKAFPFGRFFGTLVQSTLPNALPPPFPRDAQRQANLNTIGHLPWLTTHRLTAASTNAAERMAGAVYDKETADFKTFNDRHRTDGRLECGWTRLYTSGAKLAHVQGDPQNPFWVVETAPEVIDGHSGIFMPIFTHFLGQLVDDRMRPV